VHASRDSVSLGAHRLAPCPDVGGGGEGGGGPGVCAAEAQAGGAVGSGQEGEGARRQEEGAREPQDHLCPRQAVRPGVRRPGKHAVCPGPSRSRCSLLLPALLS